MSVLPSASAGPAQVAPRAGLALALLLAINLFNYIDRQVLSAVLPQAGARRRPSSTRPTRDLKTQARAADHRLHGRRTCCCRRCSAGSATAGPRWGLVGVGVIVWSLASGASGLATGFCDAAPDPLLRRRRRGRLRAGRPGHALGPVPGAAPRQGDGVVLHGHPGRQRPGVRDRRAGGRHGPGLARGLPGGRPARPAARGRCASSCASRPDGDPRRRPVRRPSRGAELRPRS